MEDFTVSGFEALNDKMPAVGIALVKSYDKAIQKDNREYVRGSLSTKTGEIKFKAWPGPVSELMIRNDFNSLVVGIQGSMNVYNGMKTLIIDNITPLEGHEVSNYQQIKYDKGSLQNEFFEILKDNLSDEGKQVFETLLGPVIDRFTTEQAALGHHDAVVNGLLAHSLKCLRILDKNIDQYTAITERCDKDLLYIGTGLHDIGKVIEYSDGAISTRGKLISHRTLAVMMLRGFEKRVIGLKGEDFYYRLMGIFEQHHGEYEETPRTFEAMVVHNIDRMEAAMTDLNETAEKYASGETAFTQGYRLS